MSQVMPSKRYMRGALLIFTTKQESMYSQTKSKRLIFVAVTLASIFVLPWWFSSLLGIIGIFLYSWFFEVLFAALLVDVFYGGGETKIWVSATLLCAALVLTCELLIKPSTRWYEA